MDPFEEFEFRPLTEGLGFHKKAIRLEEEAKKSHLDRDVYPSDLPQDRPRSLLGEKSEASPAPTTNDQEPKKDIKELFTSLPDLDMFDDEASAASLSSKARLKNEAKPSWDELTKEPEETKSPWPDEESYSNRKEKRPLPKENSYKRSFSSPKPAQVNEPRFRGFDLPAPGEPTSETMKRQKSTVQPDPTPLAPEKEVPDSSSLDPAAESAEAIRQTLAAATATTPSAVSIPTPAAAPAKVQPQTTATPAKRQLVDIPLHLGAIILDTIMITGLTLLFAVALMIATDVNLAVIWKNIQSDFMTQVSAGFLVIAVQQLYMIMARCFCASSLGEWAFEIQLGTEEQQNRFFYPVQIAWRSGIVALTGYVLMPFLSLIFRKDVAGILSGVKLKRRFYVKG